MESEENLKQSQERRKFPRLIATVDFDCTVISRGRVPSQKGKEQLKNISAGGICLIVYEKVEKDDILALTIKLPDEENVFQVKGRVVWTEEFELASDTRRRWDTGIEFIEISEVDREKIARCVFSLKR